MWYVLGYPQNRAQSEDFEVPIDIPESGGSDMGGTQPKDSKNLGQCENSSIRNRLEIGTHGMHSESEIHWQWNRNSWNAV